MKFRWAFLFFVVVVLMGCKDASLPTPLGSAISQAKGFVTGNRLPESDSREAVANHGLQTLLNWAEEGDGKAQFFVAVAYLDGQSVPKNFAAAEKWALRAANQGVPPAQYLMGFIRLAELKGTQDLSQVTPLIIRAYMWFSLSAAGGHKPAVEERDRLQSAMDNAMVNRAQEMAANWRPCASRACWDRDPVVSNDR
jgi:TPR repeat protein